MYNLRTISENDYKQVSEIIKEAFEGTEYGYQGESELVDKIRKDKSYKENLEIIAEDEKEILGHGLLSEIYIGQARELALAPLAVKNSRQGQGIGRDLLLELEKRALTEGYNFISILVHPGYYYKLGYKEAKAFDIKSPFDVPSEAFMIKELSEDSLSDVKGTVEYIKAFS